MTLKNFHATYPSWTVDAVRTGLHPGLGTYGQYLREFVDNQDNRNCPEFFCDSPTCRFNLHVYEKFSDVLNSVDAEEVLLLLFTFRFAKILGEIIRCFSVNLLI